MNERTALRDRVQHNCHVSDAQHARSYTLCIYLLKMREYFRWERGMALGASLPNAELGEWMQAREAFWDGLEDAPFAALNWRGSEHGAFDAQALNAGLTAAGLVYSAGLGLFGKPHFLLAELSEQRQVEGLTVLISGTELARDLSAPPAMRQGNTVYVRREALRRSIWETLQDWQWKRLPGPLATLLAQHGCAARPLDAIDAIAAAEEVRVVDHEIGEARAAALLPDDWATLVHDLAGTPVELLARALRDLLADALTTLPGIVCEQDWHALHWHMASLRGMRRALAPGLAAAYEQDRASGRMDGLERLLGNAPGHWVAAAACLHDRWRRRRGGTRQAWPEVAELALEAVP